MNSLDEFLVAKRAIVKARQPGWIKAMNLLSLHEKREKLLAQNDHRLRTSRTAASHRKKIEKRILDLQTLTVEISPVRGALGELIITVKTDDFPRPIPIRRFFTNALYLPAFQITKHHLFRLIRFIDSIKGAGAGIEGNGNEDSDLFHFYGWDGTQAVIKIWKPGESRSRKREGRYYLISHGENGSFTATEVRSRVIRTAVQTNPAPAFAVQRAEAWVFGSRFHKPSRVGSAGELQAVGKAFDHLLNKNGIRATDIQSSITEDIK